MLHRLPKASDFFKDRTPEYWELHRKVNQEVMEMYDENSDYFKMRYTANTEVELDKHNHTICNTRNEIWS